MSESVCMCVSECNRVNEDAFLCVCRGARLCACMHVCARQCLCKRIFTADNEYVRCKKGWRPKADA